MLLCMCKFVCRIVAHSHLLSLSLHSLTFSIYLIFSTNTWNNKLNFSLCHTIHTSGHCQHHHLYRFSLNFLALAHLHLHILSKKNFVDIVHKYELHIAQNKFLSQNSKPTKCIYCKMYTYFIHSILIPNIVSNSLHIAHLHINIINFRYVCVFCQMVLVLCVCYTVIIFMTILKACFEMPTTTICKIEFF